jgi:hypothetical protein
MGMPMPPEKLEELLQQMNEPKVAHTLVVRKKESGRYAASFTRRYP